MQKSQGYLREGVDVCRISALCVISCALWKVPFNLFLKAEMKHSLNSRLGSKPV